MKPALRAVLSCLGILCASLLGLVLTQPAALRPTQAFPSSPNSDHALSFRPRAEPIDLESHWKILHEYRDFGGEEHRFYCHIAKSAYSGEISAFGLPLETEVRWTELDERLRRVVAEEARDLQKYSKIEISHVPGTDWNWKLEDRKWDFRKAPAGDRQKIVQAANRFELWLQEELAQRAAEIANQYYREKGFILQEEGSSLRKVGIDYKGIRDKAYMPLADCYQALLREAGARDESQLVSLMLAFFQEMKFEHPPELESGLIKAKFWTPLEVMKRREGDCDSKGVGLCSLWRGYPTQILLIEEELPLRPHDSLRDPGSPQESSLHLLVGIEAEPQGDQAYVEIGLRRFVLCEVAGPVKYQPGRRPKERLQHGRIESGSFRRYLCITDDCPGNSVSRSQV